MAERVFLCDDDAGYRMLLREVLSAEGMEIVGEGGDGAACIGAVAEAEPDVVPLDINMPGMNGFEALPVLRGDLPDAKLIALSSAPAEQLVAAPLLGADGTSPSRPTSSPSRCCCEKRSPPDSRRRLAAGCSPVTRPRNHGAGWPR
jgi:two-component system, chemotaxis family, chemotaxis protein CheY